MIVLENVRKTAESYEEFIKSFVNLDVLTNSFTAVGIFLFAFFFTKLHSHDNITLQ